MTPRAGGCLRVAPCLHNSYFDALSCCVIGSSRFDAAHEHVSLSSAFPVQLVSSGRRAHRTVYLKGQGADQVAETQARVRPLRTETPMRFYFLSMASMAANSRSKCGLERRAPESSSQGCPTETPHVGQGTEDAC